MEILRRYTTLVTPENSQEIMPYSRSKRSRSYSGDGSRKSRKYSRRRTSVPRTIATRGTPDGYYEIPVHSYTKIYVETHKGMFFTDQITGNPNFSQPYGPGFGYSTSLDAEYFNLGDSVTYSTISKTITNFISLQQVFDECKIAEIKHEFWFAYQAPVAADAGYAGGTPVSFQSNGLDCPELWLTVDPNNAEPFNSMDECVQYQQVRNLKAGRTVKFSYKPTIRYDVGSDDQEAGTAVTLAATQPSTYIQTAKPGVIHFGMRGFLNISSVNNVPIRGYLHIKTTQIRRFKRVT